MYFSLVGIEVLLPRLVAFDVPLPNVQCDENYWEVNNLSEIVKKENKRNLCNYTINVLIIFVYICNKTVVKIHAIT